MGKMVSANGSVKEKSNNRGSQPERGRVAWKGYVNVTLSASEKSLYREWRADPANCEKALQGALDAGYKISVDYQSREGAYRAGLYCQAPDSINAGWCLSEFAGGWWEAINRVVFIHSALLAGDWSKVASKSGWTDSW